MIGETIGEEYKGFWLYGREKDGIVRCGVYFEGKRLGEYFGSTWDDASDKAKVDIKNRTIKKPKKPWDRFWR